MRAMEMGYAQSKWVAEEICDQFAKTGLSEVGIDRSMVEVTVMRIGQLSGDLTNGIWNAKEVSSASACFVGRFPKRCDIVHDFWRILSLLSWQKSIGHCWFPVANSQVVFRDWTGWTYLLHPLKKPSIGPSSLLLLMLDLCFNLHSIRRGFQLTYARKQSSNTYWGLLRLLKPTYYRAMRKFYEVIGQRRKRVMLQSITFSTRIQLSHGTRLWVWFKEKSRHINCPWAKLDVSEA